MAERSSKVPKVVSDADIHSLLLLYLGSENGEFFSLPLFVGMS